MLWKMTHRFTMQPSVSSQNYKEAYNIYTEPSETTAKYGISKAVLNKAESLQYPAAEQAHSNQKKKVLAGKTGYKYVNNEAWFLHLTICKRIITDPIKDLNLVL